LFNFFDSLKKEFKLKKENFGRFNVVLVSNDFLYIEGHKGLMKLTKDNIAFKVKGGVLVIKGVGLLLKELTQNTVAIGGKIQSFEVV
jgi:sporulation protein YqfC